MNTEITDREAKNGWVLYDGDCRICTGLVRRFGNALIKRGFACTPLQTPWVRERLNMPEDELMLEMRVLNGAGNVVGGAAAVLLLARTFWWGLPLVALAHVPGGFKLLDTLYRWGAARRYCVNGACEVSRPRRHPVVLFLLVLVPFLLHDVPPWIFMWAMAAALWLAVKLFTFLDVPHRPFARSLAYFAWPGMDAPEFFARNISVPKPLIRDWVFTVLNVVCGVALLYPGVHAAYPWSPLLAGWIGMAGIIFVLHFGTFKLLGLFWRRLGIPATPMMNFPLAARSLSEFWSRRWNTAFSIPARRYIMEPVAPKVGATLALLLVFLVSGLVHELVISLPARAGYGLPTLYFLIQSFGMILERRKGANRLLTLLCVAAPAFMLFHPPFVHRVILPFLNAIGAL